MRKYLAATVMGALLVAGQAAATDSDVVGAGDVASSQSADSQGLVYCMTDSPQHVFCLPPVWLGLAAAATIGLIAWGVLERPAPPPPVSD